MAIYYPPAFINGYLQDKISTYFRNNPLDGFSGDFTLPFFPTMPTDIDTLTQSFPNGEGKFAVYDRMFKMRRSPFPHVKGEQLLYYFYSTGENPAPFIIETSQLVQDLLDGEDESAQDLNDWIKARQESESPLVDDNNVSLPLPYFHKIKVYQLEETRDIIDFGTARTFAGNKIIIDYEWHK